MRVDKEFAKVFFEQAREKILKKFAPSSEDIGPTTSQVAQSWMEKVTGIGKEMSKGIGPSIIQVAQKPCNFKYVDASLYVRKFTNFTFVGLIEIGKGQKLAYASRNLPSHGRGWSKEMEPSTSQVARQCGKYYLSISTLSDTYYLK